MILKKYTSNWIKNFTDIKRKIEVVLNGIEYNIEHVGSTSIPNLDAKPIIDIDIIYFNSADFEIIKSKLEKIGYYHNGNQGIEDREVFKRNGQLTTEILDVIKHHLYVCPVGSEALERHILSRNFLRKNDWARLKYQQMKYELAEKANQDKKQYAALKEQNINDFIDSIIAEEKESQDLFLNLSERFIASRQSTFATSFNIKIKEMQKKILFIGFVLMMTNILQLNAQNANQDGTYKKWFVGSTIFLLGNLSTVNPPNFAQLNVGYRITAKDVITLEPKTWKYAWPNGIHPFANKAYGKAEEKFPGYVREFGISLSYQRFLWKGLYTELNVMPTLQNFMNGKGKKLDNGFQIFNTYRVGYQINFFKKRFFIQPSVAITHRAFHTKLPNGFKQLDDKWSKFVIGEPGFHFGFNF